MIGFCQHGTKSAVASPLQYNAYCSRLTSRHLWTIPTGRYRSPSLSYPPSSVPPLTFHTGQAPPSKDTTSSSFIYILYISYFGTSTGTRLRQDKSFNLPPKSSTTQGRHREKSHYSFCGIIQKSRFTVVLQIALQPKNP